MNALRIGSLFSGYGALDLAVEEVTGGRTVWVSDVDPGACAILAHHFPGVPNLGDITTVDWSAVEPVEVICGGSPCPDLSHAGRRAGMTEGTRSNLWAAMREAIAALRPQLVIWENVDGAHSADADSALEPCPGCVGDRRGGAVLRALGRVLGDLASLGYDAQWVSLRAADVGACHGRRRVFVVAHAQGERHQWPGAARDWVAGLADSGSESLTLLPTPMTTDANGAGAPEGQGYRGVSLTDATVRQPARWGDYAAAIARHEALYGPAPDPTEPRGRGGTRMLSPAFVEWMMCLPSGWVTDPAIWEGWTPSAAANAQLRALGNGVVPPQATAATRWLLSVAAWPPDSTGPTQPKGTPRYV